MGYGVGYRTYHTSVVRGSLTQSINTKVPAMLEEIVDSFDTQIGMPTGRSASMGECQFDGFRYADCYCMTDYEPFPMYDIIAMTVAKASNCVFVGAPLCKQLLLFKQYSSNMSRLARNKEYLQVAIDYAQAVVISAEIVRNFPDWLKR